MHSRRIPIRSQGARHAYAFTPCDSDALLLPPAEAGAPLADPSLVAICRSSTPAHQKRENKKEEACQHCTLILTSGGLICQRSPRMSLTQGAATLSYHVKYEIRQQYYTLSARLVGCCWTHLSAIVGGQKYSNNNNIDYGVFFFEAYFEYLRFNPVNLNLCCL